MRRVLRWTVPVDDQPHEIGSGPVTLVASRHTRGAEVEVWTIEDGTPSRRLVQVFGTGQRLPEATALLGSCLGAGGALVWHVLAIEDRP